MRFNKLIFASPLIFQQLIYCKMMMMALCATTDSFKVQLNTDKKQCEMKS